MYHYLAVPTLKGDDDRCYSEGSDVVMITMLWCLLPFNVVIVALLVVFGTEYLYDIFH